METKPTKELNSTQTTIHESKTFPFLIVETTSTNEETQESTTIYKIAVQNQIISQKTFDSIQEVENYIDTKDWELILNLIGLTIQITKEYEKFK